jgi:hypothetical protein
VLDPDTLRLFSLSATPTSIFVARSAGAIPNTIPASTVADAVKVKILQSAGSAVPRGGGSSDCPQRATIRPSAPPAPASNKLSVSSCRMRRARVAPIERRTEISRWRVAVRERRRFATFAQTSRSTGATTAPMRGSARTWLASLSYVPRLAESTSR